MFRLEGEHHVEDAMVPFGAILTLDDPFRCEIDTRALGDPHGASGPRAPFRPAR
ncbi:hypothetical protein GCM10009557_43920 [Virgisporangium ochraceum]|uniref:Uncharacterized protein n=1 Tax=Virgisporangium ochraceum TaxID=65505 RepID=A0A8J4A3L3_9ACTN|nr:hypothetical protein Voc01_076420 [Virgisporangium ochraceum]